MKIVLSGVSGPFFLKYFGGDFVSSDLYEVLSLAARYLFALLGVLIVLRSFIWLMHDRAERRLRLRNLPDAGMIGELTVLAGSADLSPGTVIPVPWEGVMGSVRSCDLYIPCEGIRKQHLSFSFQPGNGLLIHPWNGCEARVNDVLLTCKSRMDEMPMVNGSFLQAGSALLRLRLFAGLNHCAGFNDSESFPFSSFPYQTDERNRSVATDLETQTFDSPMTGYRLVDTAGPDNVEFFPDSGERLIPCPENPDPFSQDLCSSDHSAEQSPALRQKRSGGKWEADWSE